MAAIQFQPGPSTGNFTATVVDNNGAPTNVLEASQPFAVNCSWTLDRATNNMLGGQWEPDVYAESIGPGAELKANNAPVVVPLAFSNVDPASDTAVVTVTAGTFPDPPAPGTSSTYKLVTTLTHRNFGSVTNIAAIEEGPVVRII